MMVNWDYVAGFTDGEGNIAVIGKGPRVTWGQVDLRQIEAIRDFLIAEGMHPLMYHYTRTGNQRDIYMLSLCRRSEVLGTIESLLPRVILKREQCLKVRAWIEANPSKSNRDEIDLERFEQLYKQGFTQHAIADRMGHCVHRIGGFARKHGFVFKPGGRIVDGRRLPRMAADERRKHKAEKSRTGICPICDGSMYFDSKMCLACTNLNRPKRGSKTSVSVDCKFCGKPKLKQQCQLNRYPDSFCNRGCRARWLKSKWSLSHDRCVDCGSTNKPHLSKGRCSTCYNKWYQRKGKRS